MSSTLFARLIDDAAVFPPGNAPLPQAVREHETHTAQWYAPLTGPLLVPAGSWVELAELRQPGDAPIEVGLIARPGSDPGVITTAIHGLADHPTITVVGAELGWYEGWYGDLAGTVPAAVEIPRGSDQDRAIAQVRAADREDLDVVAKFRTGPTPTWAWPDEEELASVLDLLVPEHIPFKLTGGLHHAVRGRYVPGGEPATESSAEDNHGLLNILVAVRRALERVGHDELVEILSRRDGPCLADEVRGWDSDSIVRVREVFTAYGCCTVTDPIGELVDLGLLHPDHPTTRPPTTRP